jgi:hypothetical protein
LGAKQFGIFPMAESMAVGDGPQGLRAFPMTAITAMTATSFYAILNETTQVQSGRPSWDGPFAHSSVAQWQSIRLLTGGL